MKMMNELWEKFIFEFCKVEFACWNDAPNWLGWILIGIGGMIFLGLTVLCALFILLGILNILTGRNV